MLSESVWSLVSAESLAVLPQLRVRLTQLQHTEPVCALTISRSGLHDTDGMQKKLIYKTIATYCKMPNHVNRQKKRHISTLPTVWQSKADSLTEETITLRDVNTEQNRSEISLASVAVSPVGSADLHTKWSEVWTPIWRLWSLHRFNQWELKRISR